MSTCFDSRAVAMEVGNR